MSPHTDAGALLKLAPCPFCGCKTIARGYIRDGRIVSCMKCRASTRAFQPDADDKAAKLWNTRQAASHGSAGGEREAIARIIEPNGFHLLDELAKPESDGFPNRGEAENLASRQADLAYTKADAILALTPAQAVPDSLRTAAERVCWFDWSDNDMDACAAMDALRRALTMSSANCGGAK